MFLDFYKMREQPFGVTPDPRFLFLGASHREALASLFCGVEADRGFIALIAHPGMGKTTLTFQLLEKLQCTARTAFLFQTQCNSRELFQYLLNDLDADSTGMDMVAMHNKLNEILFEERQAGRRVVLAIDEAQNLEPAVLETIRLLSNFETPGAKLLQIVLIGQPQLAQKLADPALLQLKQRVTMFAHLESFDSEDTSRYIAHRLEVAGYSGSSLFTPEALGMIAEQSQGIPRNINSLCFGALSMGCAMGRKRIEVEIIREAAADLSLEGNTAPIKFATTPPEVAPRQVLSYRKGSEKRLGRLALAAISVVACIAAGVGAVPSSRRWTSHFWPHSAATSDYVRDSELSVSNTGVTSSLPDASTKSEATQADLAPVTLPISPRPMAVSEDPKTISIVVRPGETLRQITLRTMGKYSEKLIKQIQSLNPTMSDPNHIEANQRILVPLPPGSRNIANAASVSADGSNRY